MTILVERLHCQIESSNINRSISLNPTNRNKLIFLLFLERSFNGQFTRKFYYHRRYLKVISTAGRKVVTCNLIIGKCNKKIVACRALGKHVLFIWTILFSATVPSNVEQFKRMRHRSPIFMFSCSVRARWVERCRVLQKIFKPVFTLVH